MRPLTVTCGSGTIWKEWKAIDEKSDLLQGQTIIFENHDQTIVDQTISPAKICFLSADWIDASWEETMRRKIVEMKPELLVVEFDIVKNILWLRYDDLHQVNLRSIFIDACLPFCDKVLQGGEDIGTAFEELTTAMKANGMIISSSDRHES